MSRIYTNLNKIKFTDISEKYKVNRIYRAKLSELHAIVITYVSKHYKDTNRYKQKVVNALNLLTYFLYTGDTPPAEWKLSSPLENIPDIEQSEIEEVLADIYLTVDAIDWNLSPTDFAEDAVTENPDTPEVEVKAAISSKSVSKTKKTKSKTQNSFSNITPTLKQDLYIQSPEVPRFDYTKKWLEGTDGIDNFAIYTTLPEIPTKQNEISCTTDVSRMTSEELMKLYPNVFIPTRGSVFYEREAGLDYEDYVGNILPIGNGKYTREQLIDNIIKYPHLFQLIRYYNNDFYSFYSHIEIDGEIHGILDIWNDLPDTKDIPFTKYYVKEYVVRRYLLERDIDHIQHKYPIFGALDPFLTLFMPADEYIRKGYKDVEGIAKQCVVSRVNYKISRNPIIRRLNQYGIK